MMEHETDQALAKRLKRLRRHGRWILAGTVLGALAAALISLCLPKIYRATTYVLVSESKIGAPPQNPAWPYALLPTYLPFVDNDALITRAIEHFHLDQAPHHLTVQRFRERDYLDVRIPKSTRLLEISVEFPDARLAADLANYLAQTAAEFNDQMNATDTVTTQKFLKQRVDQAAAHLADTEAKRLQVRERARIEDKEKGLSILLGQKEQVSTELEKLQLALVQNESRAKSLEQALSGEPRTFQLKKSVTSDRFLERATEKLGEDNQGGLSATEETLNTTRVELQRQFAEASTGAAGARAGIQTAASRQQQIDVQINRLLGNVTQLRSEIDKAERDFALAREAYESASRDHRNAAVTVSAKSQDLKQVAPALVPERPTRPKLLLNTLLAGLLGLAVLTGTALAVESFREIQASTIPFVEEDEPLGVQRS